MVPQRVVFQFRLSLAGLRPEIWRQIHVPADFTLAQLHRVIQTVTSWRDYHLHEFSVGGKTYGDPRCDEGLEGIDERSVRLRDLGLSRGDRIEYLYDFGDEWQHVLKLEDVVHSDADQVAPLCAGGERSTPPEDVGGALGYQDFLEALANPEHAEHENMRSWIGHPFDPTHFSTAEINRRLRGRFRPRKTAGKTRTVAR